MVDKISSNKVISINICFYSAGVLMLAVTTARAAACTPTTVNSCPKRLMEPLGSFTMSTLPQTMRGWATVTDTSICLKKGKA